MPTYYEKSQHELGYIRLFGNRIEFKARDILAKKKMSSKDLEDLEATARAIINQVFLIKEKIHKKEKKSSHD